MLPIAPSVAAIEYLSSSFVLCSIHVAPRSTLLRFDVLLTVATIAVGTVGLAFTAVPFLASWEPSGRAKALGAPVSVDASKLQDGQMLKIIWRGQPVFVIRRQKAVVAKIMDHNELHQDPDSRNSVQPPYIEATGAVRRALNPEFWPAPRNLTLPPYTISDTKLVVIGKNPG